MFVCLKNKNNALVNLDKFDVVDIHSNKVIAYNTSFNEADEEDPSGIGYNICNSIIVYETSDYSEASIILDKIKKAIEEGKKLLEIY